MKNMQELKPKKTVDELIGRMKDQGVKFTIESEEDAKHYLSEHTYYFKLMSYRENYRKNQAGPDVGKYLFLEYAYLKELSIIDMHLRYEILKMSLEIEHSLKTWLLRHAAEQEDEDGYETVSQFIENERTQSPDGSSRAYNKIVANKDSKYCNGLVEKYNPQFPIWVFVELVPFGELVYFVDFYTNKYGIKGSSERQALLNSVRDLRNVAAHSNCLINNLTRDHYQYYSPLVVKVSDMIGESKDYVRRKLQNECLSDFTCLMLAYDKYVLNEEMKKRRYAELSELFENRINRHPDWFEKNDLLKTAYGYAKKVIDALRIK